MSMLSKNLNTSSWGVGGPRTQGAIQGGLTGASTGGWVGAAIGAIGGWAAGDYAAKEKAKAEEQRRQELNRMYAEAEKDRQLQIDFAKHGLKYRVEDALESGIHPLAALGVQPTTYNPVGVGADPGRPRENFENPLWDATLQAITMSNQQAGLERDILELKKEEQRLKNSEMRFNLHVGTQEYIDKAKLRGKGYLAELYGIFQPKGTKENPADIFVYGKDQYSGQVLPFPNQELFEGTDNAVGKGAFYYGISREGSRDVFAE